MKRGLKNFNDEKIIPKCENQQKQLEDDFVVPDGGWGWMVVLACGLSNLCVFVLAQNFGLIFRERIQQLGLSSSQITTIMNVNLSVTAFLGLANGPMFKKFSFRQVAILGGIICSIAIMCLSMTSTFYEILICMSIFHATGMGITSSANALALYTYFKKKRRIAVGLSWTCTGLGPIIMPQIITFLIPIYGVSGTALILGALSLHTVASALILRPISSHTKKLSTMEEIRMEVIKEKEVINSTSKESKNSIISSIENIFGPSLNNFTNLTESRQEFGSQYLFYDDKHEGATGIDVISSKTPMISWTNDDGCTVNETERRNQKISHNRILQPPLGIIAKCSENLTTNENDFLENENKKLKSKMDFSKDCELVEDKSESIITKWTNAICIFFDLNLLKDYVLVNLIIGTTLATFVELNFAFLTPFILADYGLTSRQIATVMSTLATVDVTVRLLIPFIASKIGWTNRTFFLIGIGCMATGRVIIAHESRYDILIIVSILIGFGKGLRTVFVALVIPTHVPLSRLPAATGLELLTHGIIYTALGPLVGWIRDASGNFTIPLHTLNIFTYITITTWLLEIWIMGRKNKQTKNSKVNENV